MSERDELVSFLDGGPIHTYPGGTQISGIGAITLADAILAAGYRKVPDDCVVVERDDLECVTDQNGVSLRQFADAHKRLCAALTATRHGED